MARSYQAVVIGGGPGGYVAAIKLGQLGVKAAVIERESMGGVCLNWGCVPSKALIHVAHTAHHVRHDGAGFGLTVEGLAIDVEKTRAWKDKIVDKLTKGVAKLVEGNGVDILRGEARFRGPGLLMVTGSDGSSEEVRFERCIIAAGARPVELPFLPYDGEVVWSARQATDIPEIPERLVVIGGGVIGLELGTVYAKLGSKVTILEMMDGLMPGAQMDRELVTVVERRLRQLKVEVLTGSKATRFERGSPSRLTVETPKGERVLEADRVLVAVGFKPNSDLLGLETVGVRTGAGGAIEVDERMETSTPGIFAVGDITGGPFLAHRAFKQGEIAAEVVAGHDAAWDVVALPAAVFTDPEMAWAGLTEEAAKAAGFETRSGKFHFLANGRALGTGEAQGFVKTVVDASSEAVLGIHIVGPGASDLVAEGTLALEMGAVADDVGLTIHAHPTLAEAVQEATAAAVGRAVHALNR